MNGLPFGDSLSCTGTDWDFNHFTDDIHDSESNTEHTWFRQLSSTQGRWMRPDPYLGSIDLANPQSLNRYAYVLNGPTLFTDPLGLWCVTTSTQTTCGDDPVIPTEFIDLQFGHPDPSSGGSSNSSGGAAGSNNVADTKKQECEKATEEWYKLKKEADWEVPMTFGEDMIFASLGEAAVGCFVGGALTVETGPGALVGCLAGAGDAVVHSTMGNYIGSMAHMSFMHYRYSQRIDAEHNKMVKACKKD